MKMWKRREQETGGEKMILGLSGGDALIKLVFWGNSKVPSVFVRWRKKDFNPGIEFLWDWKQQERKFQTANSL